MSAPVCKCWEIPSLFSENQPRSRRQGSDVASARARGSSERISLVSAGAHNTIVTSRAGKDLVSCLVSGLLTIGPRFGGAIDDAARYFQDACDRGMAPDDFVEEMKKKGVRVPGIGHRIKSKAYLTLFMSPSCLRGLCGGNGKFLNSLFLEATGLPTFTSKISQYSWPTFKSASLLIMSYSLQCL